MNAALIQALVSGILLGLMYALASLGLTIIWGIIEVVNFAQADFLMLGMFTAYWLNYLLGLDPLLTLPIAFCATFLVGIIIQHFCINRVLDAPMLTQVGVTFAFLLIIRHLALVLWGPDSRSVTTWYSSESFRVGSVLINYPMLFSSVLAVIATILLTLFLKYTDVGIALRAVSQDRTAAQLCGVNVKKMYTLAFALGVGITGLTGGLFSTMLYITPEVGAVFGLLMFTIVVLGGFRSMLGTFVGGLIVGIVESISALYLTPGMKDVPVFILFLIILIIKPSGLFGE